MFNDAHRVKKAFEPREIELKIFITYLFRKFNIETEAKYYKWRGDPLWSLIICLLKFCRFLKLSKLFTFVMDEIMLSFCISRPECFLANIARDGDSFQMIGLDVFLQIIVDGFLSTGHTFIH